MPGYNLLDDRSQVEDAVVIDWDRGRTISVPTTIDNRNCTFTVDDVTVVVSHCWHDTDGRLFNSLIRRHQSERGNPDWPGNFQPGEAILWTADQDPHDGPLRIKFQEPVSAAGAQVQVLRKGPFTAVLTVFNSSGEEVAQLTQKGESTSTGDGSAVFLGIKGPDISCIEFDTEDFSPSGVAINRLSVTP
ncbi:MAG: hypothetical protein JSR62_00300 [Nitrospira sp.]|nr:hypothetical protein [Nitrospira sp.]